MKLLLIILLSASLAGCNSDRRSGIQQSPADSWAALISTDGCLVGAQDAIDGVNEGSCLANESWVAFLDDSSGETVAFLVGRLSSRHPTKVHNCNVDLATEGELAVYALQHLTKRLWANYSGPNPELLASIAEYKNAFSEDAYISDQSVLRAILDSDSQREALVAYFNGIQAEQGGVGQPATRPESDAEGSVEPQTESEGRSR